MRWQTFITSSVRSKGMPSARASGLWFAAVAALAACTVDDRSIATVDDDDDDDSAEVAGTGGAMTNAAPPVQRQPDPVDTDDGSEGNPDPNGMLAGGGGGNIGTPTAPPSEPAPGQPMPIPPVATPLTINGRVIDEGLRPVPNLPVTIGGTTVTTGAAGEFTIGGVQAPYNASLTVTQREGRDVKYGYVFEGLTRVDPTLQVSGGLPGRSANTTIVMQNADFSNAQRMGVFAFATPDLSYTRTIRNPAGIFNNISWTGPSTILGPAHGLLVLRGGAGQVGDPITAYEAHQTAAVVLSGVESSTSLDMSANQVPTSTISGNVSASGGGVALTSVSLRFNDGVELPLVSEQAIAGPFSYLVPALAGANLRVEASANGGAARRENIVPGQTGIALSIPNPVRLSAPANGASLAADEAQFSWSASGQTATTFVWHLELAEFVEGIFIITNRTTVTIPTFADGFTVLPGTPVSWSVETHGDYADVDAATGPNGFIDPLAKRVAFPLSPTVGDGYHTESERRDFTVAP